MENKKIPKPVILIILDGWGVNQPYAGNAITQADTPNYISYISEYPAMTLRASGESVGLPWGEAGNSEVGHLNLGLGRILYQSLPRINKEISDGSFYKKETLLKAVEHTKKYNSKLHFMGVVSNGCVHASIDHLYALMVFARENNIKDVYIHAMLDGRDVSFDSGINFIKGVEHSISEYGIGKIASIAGRFYAMDRNNNWDRTEKSYLAITEGKGNKAFDAISAIQESYKKGVFDEEFVPTVIMHGDKPVATIDDNDAVVFYNFRPDRARQITKAFLEKDFTNFLRSKYINNLFFACFTEYEKGLCENIVFLPENNNNGLGECLSRAGVSQLRISETEKYAHVTYFFNGGREDKSEKEDHSLVPSPAVASYSEKPEMSSEELTRKILDAVESDFYDFILVNFPNADMVGHTGNIKAAIQGIEALDKRVGEIVDAVLKKDGVVLITADHGNADVMFNMQTGQIDKEHTTNPVPFIIIGNKYRGHNFGWKDVVDADLSMIQPQGILSDIAPTVLKIMGIEKPKEMTGLSLI